jgi:hypothetical protein
MQIAAANVGDFVVIIFKHQMVRDRGGREPLSPAKAGIEKTMSCFVCKQDMEESPRLEQT